MKRLIVNADDFGFTHGVNRAILEVLPFRFIQSTSVIVTTPAVEEVWQLVRDFPDVSVGLHWNLTVGQPVCSPKAIPSLVRSNGEFYGAEFPRRCFRHLFDVEDMKRELRAQVDKLRDFGVRITHWDTHEGRFLYPQFFEAARDVALEKGLRTVRTTRYYLTCAPGPRWWRVGQYYLAHPRRILSHWLGARKMAHLRREGFRMPDRVLLSDVARRSEDYADPKTWEDMLRHMPEGLNITFCHPGHPDDALRRYSGLVEDREKEYELFHCDLLTRQAAACGVEMVSYNVLAGSAESPGS